MTDPESRRETYIPLRHSELIHQLIRRGHIVAEDVDAFDDLAKRLSAIFHVEHLSTLLRIEDLYAQFDPDEELPPEISEQRDGLDRNVDQMIDRLSTILFSAHYRRMSREELEHAIEIGCEWGVRLDVDFSVFRRLEVFSRGYRLVTRRRRRWQRLFFEERTRMPIYRRLVLVFQLNPSKRTDSSLKPQHVYLKVFKNIFEQDVEMLLPGTKVKMTLWDRGLILFPALSGAAVTAYKIARGLILITVASLFGLVGWLLLIGAVIGYVIKSVAGYFRTRDKYQFGLTRQLYYKNLDNNAGVVYRLFNEAEEQELCETILSYAVLSSAPGERGLTERELDLRAERFLLRVASVDIDFDLHDALGKLARLELAQVDSEGRWRVVPLERANEMLEQNWTRHFQRIPLAAAIDGAERGSKTDDHDTPDMPYSDLFGDLD